MSQKYRKAQWKRRQAKWYQKNSIFIYGIIVLLAIGMIAGVVVASSSSPLDASLSEDIAKNISDTNTIGPAPCVHREETSLVGVVTEPRMETTLSLDLTKDNIPAFLEFLVVSADQPAYLTNGNIKPAQMLDIGDEVLMTGDQLGIIQSVKTELYTPDPATMTTDRNGNGYQRLLAKSKRFTENLLYLHVAGEVIKTTPEHPFYVDGSWVEAQDLSSGSKIRSQNGMGVTVERIENVHAPQFVYSLQVEGAQNFYVGEGSLLAHNCTPNLSNTITRRIGNVMRRYPATSGKCAKCADEIYNILTDAGFDAQIGHIQGIPGVMIVTKKGVSLSDNAMNPHHRFVQVGDYAFDSLTGPNGMHWDDYQRLFYDGVFDDGTFAVNYLKP